MVSTKKLVSITVVSKEVSTDFLAKRWQRLETVGTFVGMLKTHGVTYSLNKGLEQSF